MIRPLDVRRTTPLGFGSAIASGVSPDQSCAVLGPKSVQTGRYGNIRARVYTSATIAGDASPNSVQTVMHSNISIRVYTSATTAGGAFPGQSRAKFASNSVQTGKTSNISVRVYIHQRDHSGWCITGSKSCQADSVQTGRHRSVSAHVYTSATTAGGTSPDPSLRR